MPLFKYRKISRSFFKELGDNILSGESAVLIGARYCGKRRVINRIVEILKEYDIAPIVRIKLLRKEKIKNEKNLRDLINNEISFSNKIACVDEQWENSLFTGIDWLCRETGKPVILLASNIDDIAHHLVRQFLEGVRTRVETKKLIVVLSGEDSFIDLVHGPKSEFNCANQFVLQGFSRHEFSKVADEYMRPQKFRFNSHETAISFLWEHTGGQIFLLRMLLWAIAEKWVRKDIPLDTPVKISDIPHSIELLKIPFAYGSQIARYADEIIFRVPEQWHYLEELIRKESVKINIQNFEPTSLELAGLAIRKANYLHFASPLIKEFVISHFNPRRLGDLHAFNGEWHEAFEYYSQFRLNERQRPLGMDDRSAVLIIVNAFCSSLYREADNGLGSLKRFVAKGLNYIIGFKDVTFWQYDHTFQIQPLTEPELPAKAKQQLTEIISEKIINQAGFIKLPGTWGKYLIGIALPAMYPYQYSALIVGDFNQQYIISRESDNLANKVLEHFEKAYSHAVSVEQNNRRLQVRNHHIKIINSVNTAFRDDVLHVGAILSMAAKGLRTLGYSRVLFCMVDAEGKKIKGILDDSDDSQVNIAELINVSLDEYHKDLYAYVINSCKPAIIDRYDSC